MASDPYRHNDEGPPPLVRSDRAEYVSYAWTPQRRRLALTDRAILALACFAVVLVVVWASC